MKQSSEFTRVKENWVMV